MLGGGRGAGARRWCGRNGALRCVDGQGPGCLHACPFGKHSIGQSERVASEPGHVIACADRRLPGVGFGGVAEPHSIRSRKRPAVCPYDSLAALRENLASLKTDGCAIDTAGDSLVLNNLPRQRQRQRQRSPAQIAVHI